MAIVNKVTRLCPPGGTMSEELIQAHLDEQNVEGWYLVSLDNISGWYRFFWAKEIVDG
jgi:hypothetical protein